MRKDDQTHILVAEDEEHLLGTMAFILKMEGFSVSTAVNGREAMEIILTAKESTNPVKLLISDVGMPIMGGLELMDELKKTDLGLPTLILSGYQDEKTKDEFLRRGCIEYFIKPFETNNLLGCIRAALEKDIE